MLIDIVSEPTCYGNAFYPTEKIARAILCKRPFIVMASKNYLLYLRQMGFKTFFDFWDEQYDMLDGRNRYLHILKLLDQIAATTDIHTMYSSMKNTLEHNFNLLMTQQFKKL